MARSGAKRSRLNGRPSIRRYRSDHSSSAEGCCSAAPMRAARSAAASAWRSARNERTCDRTKAASGMLASMLPQLREHALRLGHRRGLFLGGRTRLAGQLADRVDDLDLVAPTPVVALAPFEP